MASCMNCPVIPKVDEKNPKIVCGGCDRQICVKCSGLCATELRVVVLQSPTLKYLCPDCKLGIRQLPALRKLVAQLKDEIDAMKKSQSQGPNVESVICEINERDKRQKNVIMFGVPELCNGTDGDSYRRHDLEKVNVALTNILHSEPPLAAIRLGKPSQSPRPMKLIFARRSSAITVLKNAKNLPVGIKVKNDLTPYQREYLKGLREDLENRIQNGESDLTIKYVNNAPKIIKKGDPPKN